MGTKTFITAILIVAAAVWCADARERFGKLTRQARQVRPFSSTVNQPVVTNAVNYQDPQPQAEQFETESAPQAIPQARQYQQQAVPSNLQPYQPVPQQLQQVQQQQYQPIQPQQNLGSSQQQVAPGVQQQYRPVVPQTAPTAYPQPQPSPFQSSSLINQVSGAAPAYSQFVSVKTTRTLVDKLPSNSTRIRPNLVEGFSCAGKRYGYYADTLNDCQVFHVCYPLKDVFNNHPEVPDITYDFSFICNDFLAFDQSSLTCGWATEVVPCESAEELYDLVNSRFFEIPKTTAPQGGAAAGASGGYPAPAPFPGSAGTGTGQQVYPAPGQSVAPSAGSAGAAPQVYPAPGQSVPAAAGTAPLAYPTTG